MSSLDETDFTPACRYNDETYKVDIFLVNIDCGSCGINLHTQSARMIITSPNNNPCVEMQAIGRIDRVGQTLPMKVWRLAILNTQEEKILLSQSFKFECISHLDPTMQRALGYSSNMTQLMAACLPVLPVSLEDRQQFLADTRCELINSGIPDADVEACLAKATDLNDHDNDGTLELLDICNDTAFDDDSMEDVILRCASFEP